MFVSTRWFVLGAMMIASTAFGQTEEPPVEDQQAQYDAWASQFLDSLQPETGSIVLGDNLATIVVPDTMLYLRDADARRVLQEAWGNPPGGPTLGMLIPSEGTILDADAWAISIEYEEDGYVNDEDAAKIDYDDMLAQMKADTKAASVARVEQNYPSIELIGWAAPPHYDANEKKLYWAKEIQFGGMDENTLNYNIRILGRKGVLVLNAIASMSQLPDVTEATPGILANVSFNDGSRYGDFNPEMDKIAAYGIGGLIAGKLVAKAGLLKVLIAFLAKGWKLIALAIIGGAAMAKRFIGGGAATKITASDETSANS